MTAFESNEPVMTALFVSRELHTEIKQRLTAFREEGKQDRH
jgi:hypothetical protein